MCSNETCPKGQYRSGECGGITDEFTCTRTPHKAASSAALLASSNEYAEDLQLCTAMQDYANRQMVDKAVTHVDLLSYNHDLSTWNIRYKNGRSVVIASDDINSLASLMADYKAIYLFETFGPDAITQVVDPRTRYRGFERYQSPFYTTIDEVMSIAGVIMWKGVRMVINNASCSVMAEVVKRKSHDKTIGCQWDSNRKRHVPINADNGREEAFRLFVDKVAIAPGKISRSASFIDLGDTLGDEWHRQAEGNAEVMFGIDVSGVLLKAYTRFLNKGEWEDHTERIVNLATSPSRGKSYRFGVFGRSGAGKSKFNVL